MLTTVGVSALTLAHLGDRVFPGTRFVPAPDDDVEVLWRRQADRTRWLVDTLAACPRVRWVHTDTAGVDRLPLASIHNRGIVLSNARGVYTDPVSQWVVAAVLMAGKRLDQLVRNSDRQVWQVSDGITDLVGQTMLLVGVGAIGGAVARVARALGLRVLGVVREASSPTTGSRPDRPHLVLGAAQNWRAFLGEASYLVITTPLTAATTGMIGAPELRRLPPGAWLINAGRAEIVDEPALCAALDDGHLGGAVLDVFAREPLPRGHPLWGRPNVLVSPHISSRSPRAERLAFEHFGRELARYRNGQPPTSQVDADRGY
jgi:phosphoglycerate dehydrogenase-like enzyme